MTCCMSKLQPSDTISDGINMRLRRLHGLIDTNKAMFKGDIRIFQTDTFHIRLPADRYQQLFPLQLHRFFPAYCRNNDSVIVLGICIRLYLVSGQNLNTAALQLLPKFARHLFIFIWQQLGGCFHHGHFYAKVMKQRRPFHADYSTPNNNNRRRQFLQHHRLVAAKHMLAVREQPRKRPRTGSGRNDQIGRDNGLHLSIG
ncbi:hypothetical protein D3C77_393260 [compost metagenome]